MSYEQSPNIILGVSGSIAACRAPNIVSKLSKIDANVHVVMTRQAAQFVAPLALQVLSKNEVILNQKVGSNNWQPTHIELADNADLLLIAPATANILGKMACGIVDNPICEVYTALPRDTPVLVAPAMNGKMLQHPSVQRNIQQLREDGVLFIDPVVGDLACGYQGDGKLAPIDLIANEVIRALAGAQNE
ncbi:phosphopantothenoylcysteine decarboxylase [Candidatus Saccharibacteria bacterium]|nr:phosphopantothenoylcysteine decarboxylase [Candidatus Saccharibacteria bacterium]